MGGRKNLIQEIKDEKFFLIPLGLDSKAPLDFCFWWEKLSLMIFKNCSYRRY